MSKLPTLAGTAAILMFTASTAFAAPCATGTTSNMQTGAKDASSNVDGGSKEKVSPGAKAESPGTVGAMNRDTPTTPGKDEKPLPEGKTVQGQNADDC